MITEETFYTLHIRFFISRCIKNRFIID